MTDEDDEQGEKLRGSRDKDDKEPEGRGLAGKSGKDAAFSRRVAEPDAADSAARPAGASAQPTAPYQSPMPTAAPAQQPSSPPPAQSQGPAGGTRIPNDALASLLSNYRPSDQRESSAGGRLGGSEARFETQDKIADHEVGFEKVGGIVSPERLAQLVESGADLNGVSPDPAVRQEFHRLVSFVVEHESGGNPASVNLKDSNAHGPIVGDGAPSGCSRGLMQMVPGTFAENHVAGTSTNIYDPHANIAAGIRYLMRRWHIGADGSGVGAFLARSQNGYVGY